MFKLQWGKMFGFVCFSYTHNVVEIHLLDIAWDQAGHTVLSSVWSALVKETQKCIRQKGKTRLSDLVTTPVSKANTKVQPQNTEAENQCSIICANQAVKLL